MAMFMSQCGAAQSNATGGVYSSAVNVSKFKPTNKPHKVVVTDCVERTANVAARWYGGGVKGREQRSGKAVSKGGVRVTNMYKALRQVWWGTAVRQCGKAKCGRRRRARSKGVCVRQVKNRRGTSAKRYE